MGQRSFYNMTRVCHALVLLSALTIFGGCSEKKLTPPSSQAGWSSEAPRQSSRKEFAPNGNAEAGIKGYQAHGTSQVTLSTNTAHSGMHSVYVGNRGQNWHGVSYFFEPVKPKEEYQISVWAKLAPGEESATLLLTIRFRGTGANYVNVASEEVTPDRWVQLKATFSHPIGELDYAYVESPNPTVSFYVDDFSLIGEDFSEKASKLAFHDGTARFNWFEYQGKDDIFDSLPDEGEFQNPILPGFHPDPSIVRVGEDFYMVHSSFAYWPGLPIYHSTDLVNWNLIGHGLTHQNEIALLDKQISEGVFAPSITYHNGTFYLSATAVWSGGSFIITAKDPQGPWSKPHFMPEIRGVDPFLFFDDDGTAYLLHNDNPDDMQLYSGHRVIKMWKFDLDTMRPVPGSAQTVVNGGIQFEDKPIWIQGPRIYKKDGWYYLSCAQGGSEEQHAQVIYRTESLQTPFQPAPINPILTQKNLAPERENPITSAGHSHMVQTPSGEWWAVFLAARTYDKTYYNFGRETYLLPVTWSKGWPMINPGDQPIPYHVPKPKGLKPYKANQPNTGNFTWRDEFDQSQLALDWRSLRTSFSPWINLDHKKHQLIMRAQKSMLTERGTPAFIGRAQQHAKFESKTEIQLPLDPGISTGLVLFQSAKYHYYLGVTQIEDKYEVFLEQAAGAGPLLLASIDLESVGDTLQLSLDMQNDSVSFYYQNQGQERVTVATEVNGKILSSSVASGVVGTHVGLYVRGY